MKEQTPVLEVRDLSKSYHGVWVLHPISFELAPGECLGIAGPNGSGKSTLLRLIAQAEKPDGGSVFWRGKNVRGDRKFLRTSLGYVPQDAELAPELTVREQLALWRAACGCTGPVQRELMDLLGLAPMLRSRISELSGGMQRRVSIAMALSTGREVLIMDEASAGLDESYREALLAWMESFLNRGGCAVWCTHLTDELDKICTHCLTVRDGRATRGGESESL